MYAIEATNEKGRRWISGFFEKQPDAEQYYSKIPAELRSRQYIREIPFSTYPFFVIENLIERGPFQYVDVMAVEAALAALPPGGTEDDELLIIFQITADFFSPEAGTDCMGLLHHEHITGDVASRTSCSFVRRRPRKTNGKLARRGKH
jgi:hypothetical protein